MPISAETVRAKILASLPDAHVEVRDTTGGGDHYAATIVSAGFGGKSLIERHRLVYAALGDAMRVDIHALSLVTVTPEEREKEKNR